MAILLRHWAAAASITRLPIRFSSLSAILGDDLTLLAAFDTLSGGKFVDIENVSRFILMPSVSSTNAFVAAILAFTNSASSNDVLAALIKSEVGKLGSLRYVLKDYKAVTKGYHSLYMHMGTLMGNLGSQTEKVFFEVIE